MCSIMRDSIVPEEASAGSYGWLSSLLRHLTCVTDRRESKQGSQDPCSARCAGMEFHYRDPERGFDRSSVKRVVARIQPMRLR